MLETREEAQCSQFSSGIRGGSGLKKVVPTFPAPQTRPPSKGAIRNSLVEHHVQF